MKEKFIRFMSGRYGSDNLSKFILTVAIICIVLQMVLAPVSGFLSRLFYWLVLILLAINIFRMFSRNTVARYKENCKYVTIKLKVIGFFKGLVGKGPAVDRSHKIFKCPSCSQKVRVPRGRGRIAITCPKCRTQFVKRS